MKKQKVAKEFTKKEVKALVKECVLTGYTFAKTYAVVKKRFPNTEFSTKKCYYWYRRHLHVGKIVALAIEE